MVHEDILEKTSKTQAIRSMMKNCKKIFDDTFSISTSECQTVIDLTKQKRVVSRADVLVTNFQNGLVKFDTASALAKETLAPTHNSCTDTVDITSKHNATAEATKKKECLPENPKLTAANTSL